MSTYDMIMYFGMLIATIISLVSSKYYKSKVADLENEIEELKSHGTMAQQIVEALKENK